MSKILKDGKRLREKKDEKLRFQDKIERDKSQEYCRNCKHSSYNWSCKLKIEQIAGDLLRWSWRRPNSLGPRPPKKGCFESQIADDKEKNVKPELPQRGPGSRWIASDIDYPQDGEISFIARDKAAAMKIALIYFDYATEKDYKTIEQQYSSRIELRIENASN